MVDFVHAASIVGPGAHRVFSGTLIVQHWLFLGPAFAGVPPDRVPLGDGAVLSEGCARCVRLRCQHSQRCSGANVGAYENATVSSGSSGVERVRGRSRLQMLRRLFVQDDLRCRCLWRHLRLWVVEHETMLNALNTTLRSVHAGVANAGLPSMPACQCRPAHANAVQRTPWADYAARPHHHIVVVSRPSAHSRGSTLS